MTVAEPVTLISSLLYGIGAITFSAAAVKAVRNYRRTKGISNYWIVFAIAVGLGAAFSAASMLQSLDIASPVLDELDGWLAIMFIFGLIMTSIETLTTRIEVTIK